MRFSILLLFALISSTHALLFPKISIYCIQNSFLSTCPHGQYCNNFNRCVPKRAGGHQHKRDDIQFSVDGQCGPIHNNLLCDPNSTVYTGTCCSDMGWCGNTYLHCGTGCVSGCTKNYTTPEPGDISIDGRCGADFYDTVCPSGQCCSQYSYCGTGEDYCGKSSSSESPLLSISTSDECTIGVITRTLIRITSSTEAHSSTFLTSTLSSDSSESSSRSSPETNAFASSGTVGSSRETTSSNAEGSSSVAELLSSTGLMNSAMISSASALSSSSFDSSSFVHSATTGEPIIGKPTISSVAPSAQSTLPVTTDGTCGVTSGGTVCGNWIYGNCCSQYGYCGNTTAHCGVGCQSGNCTGDINPAPGEAAAPVATGDDAGKFEIVGQSGVPAMHAGLLPNGKVVFLDKVENYTQIKLGTGYYAYSSEYDIDTNTYVPLAYKTNAFCSGGTYLANGDFISVGGNADLSWLDPTVGNGFTGIRYLKRSLSSSEYDGQAWSEPGNKLDSARWYATAQNLANGEIFVVSGSLNGLDPTVPANNNPSWELLDKTGKSYTGSIPMDFLAHNQPYYMYPFVNLLRDGELFIFVSKSGIIFDVETNTTLKTLPDLPGDYRTYPNTGGSIMFPLSSNDDYTSEIMICGGGAYQDITSPTEASCGRIRPEDDDPTWEMEGMPKSRGMIEGTLLPDGTSIWMNGGHYGSQGFNLSTDPVYYPILYDPSVASGSRFTVLTSSSIARLYHSVALLIPDGRIMIAGSNPVQMPILEPSEYTPYVTEFRVEIFTPPYLMGDKASRRPRNVTLSSTSLRNGDSFSLTFTDGQANTSDLKVVLYHGGFVTHSTHMGHRMIYLDYTGFESAESANATHTLTVSMPSIKYGSVTPPSPYLVFVVADGIPSVAVTVMVNEDASL